MTLFINKKIYNILIYRGEKMKKNIKRIMLTLFLILGFSSYLVSCTNQESTINPEIFDHLSFNDKSVVCDGTSHSILLEGEVPEGFTVEYTNNTGIESGEYYSIADIKDNHGNIVKSYRATLSLDNPDNQAFEDYLDEFFVAYLEGDQLSVNIFCENPSAFGLGRYTASWYTYTSGPDMSQESIEEIERMLVELANYDVSKLSQRQLIAYHQIEKFLEYQKETYEIKDIDFIKNHYVDQFGGYVADFGTYMEAYTLREKADVQDILDFIVSTEEAFSSYVTYLEDKVEAGYPLSNYTLNEMQNYLDDVLASVENGGRYYLADVLEAKVDAVEFLSAEEKSSFKEKISEAISTEFMNGVKVLREGVVSQKGKLTQSKEGYWASYANGQQVYELELGNLLGLDDFNIDSYMEELTTSFADFNKKATKALETLIRNYQIGSMLELELLLSKTAVFNGTPDEMMDYLREFAKTIVPSLKTNPNITIKEMDEASAKVSNAVAYYMKSALDNDKQEFITLNPVSKGDMNNVLSTLSHEGYPGHLYAYCFSKELNLHNISKIMTSTAHGEGWACYVQQKLYEYAIANTTNKKSKEVFEYLYYSQLSGHFLETILDAKIHCEGWKASDISKFMKQNGYDDSLSTANEIYNLLIETPASYAAYGYGKLFFYNLHEEAKGILGDNYNEIEFNTMLLSKGWTSLGELKETYTTYMKKKCHKLGLQFE